MKKMLAAFAAMTIVSCSNGTLSGPDKVEEPVASANSSSGGAQTPQPVLPPAASGFDVSFATNATWTVVNNNDIPAALSAFITNFDDQNTPIAPIQYKEVPGHSTWGGSFNKTCVQLDIDQPGVKLVAAAFFDKNGREFIPSRNPEKVTECRTPTPEPTPTPRPSPSPSPSPSPTPDPHCDGNECGPKIIGYCHVSNKGKDGNVELVVSFKHAGEGHEKHLDASKFCPVDRVVYGYSFSLATQTQKKYECKLEGDPDTAKYCTCEGLVDEAKECSQK